MVKLELKRLRVKLRASVKKLMAKGLSAQEAGRLVFMDSWEVDHDRASLLIRRDIDRLRNGLRSSKDTQEYNAIIGLYRVVDFIRREREFVYLRSILQVKDVNGPLRMLADGASGRLRAQLGMAEGDEAREVVADTLDRQRAGAPDQPPKAVLRTHLAAPAERGPARLLPTSAILTLMRASCFALSIKVDTILANEFFSATESPLKFRY